jgi:hypothetical protein
LHSNHYSKILKIQGKVTENLRMMITFHLNGFSSYSTTALSVWPWLPLVSEQFNFSGVGLLSEWIKKKKNMCAGFGGMECKCYSSRPVVK